MGTNIAVHGEQLGARRAGVPFYLALQERRHPPLADIVQIFHEAVVVSMDITLLDKQQIRAGKLAALMAKTDLPLGELAAQAFFMDAAPPPRPAADTSRLGGIENPTAEIAVHAAWGDQLAPHGNGARLCGFCFHLPDYGILYAGTASCLTFRLYTTYKITNTVPGLRKGQKRANSKKVPVLLFDLQVVFNRKYALDLPGGR
jgi:hypothetical protein